jgi:hypothetical protein
MKTIPSVLVALTLAVSAFAHADHDKKIEAGPNGGRILSSAKPAAEFWVMPDKRVQITFLNAEHKPVPPSGQVVTVTTGQRSAPVTLNFEQKGNVLVSTQPLAGDRQPAVVQIKATPNAKASVDRFTVDLSVCGGCNRAEYACTCH